MILGFRPMVCIFEAVLFGIRIPYLFYVYHWKLVQTIR